MRFVPRFKPQFQIPTWKPTAKQLEALRLLAGPQRVTLLVGGSRSGKTSLLVRSILVRAIKTAFSSHAILRFRGNAAQASISMDTLPKIHRMSFPQVPLVPRGRGNDSYFELPNQSRIWVGGLDDKERVEKILGQEHATLFFNEASQISYQSFLTAITRLAQNIEGLRQRAYIDLNPTTISHWTAQLIIKGVDPSTGKALLNPEQYKYLYMNPYDNRDNLSAEYLASLEALPERQRKRFLEGQYTADVTGALWTMEILEQNRVEAGEMPPMRRIVIGVDPSGASGQSDETKAEIGIVAVGLGEDRHAYVLEDYSCLESPMRWGTRVVALYRQLKADRIIVETNFGGAMAPFVIQVADPTVPVKVITASRGKIARAEPVSALYEKGFVHHVGRHARLEDQLCSMTTDGYIGEGSPDRADAMIWAIHEILVGMGAPVKLQSSEAYETALVVADSGSPWAISDSPRPDW